MYGKRTNENDINSIRKHLRRWCVNIYAHLIGVLVFLGPWIFLSLFFIPVCWPIVLLYVWWIYYDRDTPHNGGRKLAFGRRLKCWEFNRDYFPTKMVKTADLPANGRYIFGAFPHGILSFGLACNVMTDINRFDVAYPGLDVYTASLDAVFYIPILRDLALFFGICAASVQSIKSILSGPEGRVCVIVVGGVKEAMTTTAGINKLILRNRKGFVRLALKTGSSLVPVFSFGETNTYRQPTSKSYLEIQQKIRSKFNVPFVLLKGRGFFQDFFGLLPYRRPITTVVGAPIDVPKTDNPSEEIVDKYHQIFTSELENLFNKFKGKYDENGERATLHIE